MALYLVFLVAILIIAAMVYAPIRRRHHRQALAAQGRERALATYTQRHVAAAHLEVYQAMLQSYWP